MRQPSLLTRNARIQLDEAIKALTNDLRYASTTIQADLDRFQRQKVGDIREMCLDFSRFHKEWAMKVSISSGLAGVFLFPISLMLTTGLMRRTWPCGRKPRLRSMPLPTTEPILEATGLP